MVTGISNEIQAAAMPSLLEAIKEKYGCFEDDTFDQMPIAIYVPRKNPRNMIPNLLVLNDCDIDSAGQESDLRDKCRGVEELDLAQNCLSRWSEVSLHYAMNNVNITSKYFSSNGDYAQK